jgi:hypothetical protein
VEFLLEALHQAGDRRRLNTKQLGCTCEGAGVRNRDECAHRFQAINAAPFHRCFSSSDTLVPAMLIAPGPVWITVSTMLLDPTIPEQPSA